MMTSFQAKLDEEFEILKTTIERPNILLIGCTGSGKSSLINYCFGEALAETGVGKPVTQTIDCYSSPAVPVVIFDSKGYEIGSEAEKSFMQDVIGLTADVSNTGDSSKSIHLAWYCIQAVGARITDFDIESINRVRQNTPVAVVLTKSDLISEEDAVVFKKAIKDRVRDIEIFEVSTAQQLAGLKLGDLIDWSIKSLPDALKMAFIAAQRLSLEAKRQEAEAVILQHSALAMAPAASPIPFSDAPLLLANQYKMISRIMFIYGLDGLGAKIKALVAAAVSGILPKLGKYLVANALKLIPGFGSAAGAAINAGVASTLTYALGQAIAVTCHTLVEKGLEGSPDKLSDLLANFDDNFMQVFSKAISNKKGE